MATSGSKFRKPTSSQIAFVDSLWTWRVCSPHTRLRRCVAHWWRARSWRKWLPRNSGQSSISHSSSLDRPRTDFYPVGYRIPATLRDRVLGKRTAIVDDVINAGSAVRGATEDLQACGARVAVIGALLTLGSPASAFAKNEGVPLETLAHLPKNLLWEPPSCPLCASGVTLEGFGEPSL